MDKERQKEKRRKKSVDDDDALLGETPSHAFTHIRHQTRARVKRFSTDGEGHPNDGPDGPLSLRTHVRMCTTTTI